jgi:mannose-6-phosphate isomerase
MSVTKDGLEAFAFSARRIDKPWGYELVWAHSEHYCGKLLFIREGEQLSLQVHNRKDETIYVYQGRIEIELGRDSEPQIVEAGVAFRIPPGTVHRWRALEDALVLEASTPELDDVVRLEDRYGRAGT